MNNQCEEEAAAAEKKGRREKESLFLQQPQLLIGILYPTTAIDYTKEEAAADGFRTLLPTQNLLTQKLSHKSAI